MGKVCIAICFHRLRYQTFISFNSGKFELRISQVWIVCRVEENECFGVMLVAKLVFLKKGKFFE